MKVASQPPLLTLGLGDDDDIDLIRAIEKSFSVQFGNETSRWFTMGDLYEALVSRLPSSKAAGPCSTSMAFYRLRSYLQYRFYIDAAIRPSTKLTQLANIPPKRLFGELAKQLGIESMPTQQSWWGEFGVTVILPGLVGGITALACHPLWFSSLLVPIGLTIIWTNLRSYDGMTVGDLSRQIAARNFQHFASSGSDIRPAAVWRALCAIVADQLKLKPSQLAAETRLMT